MGNFFKYFSNFNSLLKSQSQDGFTSLPIGTGPELIQLRNGTTDIKIYEQIFLNHDVKLPFETTVHNIADCGSHVGCSALYLHLAHPNAVIHCFEAEKRNFDLLKKNTKPYPNIHCHYAAVWYEKTTVKIEDPNQDPWTFRVESADGDGEVETFTLQEITDLFDSQTLDLIKIDIEGAEKAIFEKLDPTWLEKVKVINIELHDRIVAGCTEAFHKAIEAKSPQTYQTQHNTIADLRT